MAAYSRKLHVWGTAVARAASRASFGGKQTTPAVFQQSYSVSARSTDIRQPPYFQFGQKSFCGLLLRDLHQSSKVGYQQYKVPTFRPVDAFLTGVQTRCRYSSIAPLNGSATIGNSTVRILVAGGEKAQRQVAWWLFGCAGWVGSMIILGGVTRLTRSGLSMTDWRFTGRLPPLSEEEWQGEFDKYKASPEYQRSPVINLWGHRQQCSVNDCDLVQAAGFYRINRGMPLSDFKFIYWMEYAHRMWGRALGLVFLGPFAYFTARGYVTRPLAIRLGILGSLGAGQGFVGWWMVKSGLEEPVSEHAEPRVSPYRLAAHLASAFVIYSGLLWTALTVAMPVAPIKSIVQFTAAAKVRKLVHPVAALIGITALSGAFVAGNDAGRAYNTFPKMGDSWVPETVLELEPIYRNFFENTATVQFDHRVLAIGTLVSVASLWASSSKLPLHPRSRRLLGAMLGMTALQVTLGISTLLTYVPVSLASAHQTGAIALFTIILTLMHTLRLKTVPSFSIAKRTLMPAHSTPLHVVMK